MTPARRSVSLLRPLDGPPAASARWAEAVSRVFLPWHIALPAALLVAAGLCALAVVSTAPTRLEADPWTLWRGPFGRQAAYAMAAAAVFVATASIPIGAWRRSAWTMYGLALVGLAAVLVFGRPVRGIRAWLDLGVVSLQVSELAKVALVLALARLLSTARAAEASTLALVAACAVVAAPVILVLKEPDLGTAIVFLALLVAAPYAAGLPSTYLTIAVVSSSVLVGRVVLGIAQAELGVLPAGGVAETLLLDGRLGMMVALGGLAAGILSVLALRRLGWPGGLAAFLAAAAPACAYGCSFLIEAHLKPYQRLRLLTFLAPQIDPQGSGYNVLQSQIAVGSGGWVGKGFEGASQSALGFLPEASTDFIFSVVAEAFGLLGAGAVLALFAGLLFALLSIARRSTDVFGATAVAAIAAYLGVHAIVNVGMALGVMPVMGIPLPLLSYGGSSLVATGWALGVAASVHGETLRNQ